MAYTFDSETGEYTDSETGDVVTTSVVLATLAIAVDETLSPESAMLAGLVIGGSMSATEWETKAQELVTTAFMWYLWAAVGGAKSASDEQYTMLASVLEIQMGFLAGFTLSIGNGELSEAMVAARLQLYFAAATQAYTRGRMLVMGCPDTGVHPGDCSTDCCVNCDCGWRIERLFGVGNYNLIWELGTVEKHCRHCIERAKKWNPLRVRNGKFVDSINRNDGSLFIQRSRRDASPLHPDMLVAELLRRQKAKIVQII